jgi:hypothetical protein
MTERKISRYAKLVVDAAARLSRALQADELGLDQPRRINGDSQRKHDTS